VELVCLLLIATLAVGFCVLPFANAGRYTGTEVDFGGFGHEALVAICCQMILGRGLIVTGAPEPAARSLARLWQWSAAARLLCSIVVCMAISMFVNDTPVLVLSLPILLTVVARAKIPLSKTLMPVNCAILIGGMATTIGTSSNMLVVSSRESSASRLSTCSRSSVSWLAVDRRSHLTRLASATRRCVFTQTLFHQRAGYPLTHLH
jgi:di/tricarboxylate transporter